MKTKGRFDYLIEIGRVTFKVSGYADEDGRAVIDNVEQTAPITNLWAVIEGDGLGDALQSEADEKLANELSNLDAELAATGGLGYDYVEERAA